MKIAYLSILLLFMILSMNNSGKVNTAKTFFNRHHTVILMTVLIFIIGLIMLQYFQFESIIETESVAGLSEEEKN